MDSMATEPKQPEYCASRHVQVATLFMTFHTQEQWDARPDHMNKHKTSTCKQLDRRSELGLP